MEIISFVLSILLWIGSADASLLDQEAIQIENELTSYELGQEHKVNVVVGLYWECPANTTELRARTIVECLSTETHRNKCDTMSLKAFCEKKRGFRYKLSNTRYSQTDTCLNASSDPEKIFCYANDLIPKDKL